MLIFIYGQNSYQSIKKLEAMRAKFLETVDPSRMNYVEFPTPGKQKFEIGEIMQAIKSPPFLAIKRMVVIKGLLAEFSKKNDAKVWIDALQNIPESTIVIIFEYLTVKKTQSHALFKEFNRAEGVHSYPFDNLGEADLLSWARSHVKEINLQINSRLLSQVVQMVGSDLWQLASEFNKLAAYASAETVSEEMITLLVRTNSEERIFELMDAVALRNTKLAISCLENERNFGNPDGYLFAMLARQVRLLLSARDILDRNPQATQQNVAVEMDVHPFVAQKTITQARKFRKEDLVELQEMMYKLDRKIKRSLVSESVAVDRVIAEMIT